MRKKNPIGSVRTKGLRRFIPDPPTDASSALKVDPTVKSVLIGRKSSMMTIMIGKMEIVLPDMYLKSRKGVSLQVDRSVLIGYWNAQ